MKEIIFITHLPSFYKIKLYNEIAKDKNIFVIFIAKGSVIRTKDFTDCKMNFEYLFLNEGEFEERNKYLSSLKLINTLGQTKFKKIIVGGWDLPEFWVTVFLTKKQKNCLALESTIFDSKTTYIKQWIKKVFLARIHTILASGIKHAELSKLLGFRGKILITKGVGLINKPIIPLKERNNTIRKKLLYIGRLSIEKNIINLIKAVNELPGITLSIVGDGPQKDELKNIANENIHFFGHVDNKRINKLFFVHDIFILPSFSETWGLVVDEALYFGLPVLISKYVGCAEELVIQPETGLIFDPYNIVDIKNKILQGTDITVYEELKNNVLNFDINAKDLEQVHQYLRL